MYIYCIQKLSENIPLPKMTLEKGGFFSIFHANGDNSLIPSKQGFAQQIYRIITSSVQYFRQCKGTYRTRINFYLTIPLDELITDSYRSRSDLHIDVKIKEQTLRKFSVIS